VQYIKSKGYMVHSDNLGVLKHLRITNATSLDTQTANKVESERDATKTTKLLKKIASNNMVKMSLTEKRRKHKIAQLEHKLKEKKLVEKKHKETTIQTEIIELVFSLYIYVIKNIPNRKVLGAVLEGLAM